MSDLSAIQRAKEQLRADEAADIAGAEARGYDRAIAKLRCGQGMADRTWHVGRPDISLRVAADYLEAAKDRP